MKTLTPNLKRIALIAGVGVVGLSMVHCSQNSQALSEQTLSAQKAASHSQDLFKAVVSSDPKGVVDALKNGADVNSRLGSGENRLTPLMVAVVLGKIEIANLLIINGASTSPSFYGYTVRDFAYLFNQDQLVDLIEKRGTHS